VNLGPRAAYILNFFFLPQISGIFLAKKVQWVGCQGSRPELRGYSCSLWKLFHTLTVQAALRPKALVNTGKQQSSGALKGQDKYVQQFCYATEQVTDYSKYFCV